MSSPLSEQSIEDFLRTSIYAFLDQYFASMKHPFYERCQSSAYANQTLFIVTTAIPPLVASLRVHAVSGRNWHLVLPVWLLGMVPVGTNIIVVIITRTAVVVSDILVVGATWYYISHTSSVKTQLVREVWEARPNLTTVMFRDGTLYFLYRVISLLNILDLIMNTVTLSGVRIRQRPTDQPY
ncbi:hypothetical protein IEO21_05382 [Rhodonia placenta]|uniref:Uncharacterized protein n=1 Tax=Rhodonia placenta TaxID=104341 RepID=A0A8H7U246_9APHY|nr:hypothetical protein IEO21_05382 [Postia placenta]